MQSVAVLLFFTPFARSALRQLGRQRSWADGRDRRERLSEAAEGSITIRIVEGKFEAEPLIDVTS